MFSSYVKVICSSLFFLLAVSSTASDLIVMTLPMTREDGVCFTREDFCDVENQALDPSLIYAHLTASECVFFRALRNSIIEEIETSFRNHNSLSEEQIKNIIWNQVNVTCKYAATSSSLLLTYIAANIIFSWGIEQLPYPALSSTLYSFQTVVAIALSTPILMPVTSRFTQWAFKFQRQDKKTTINRRAFDQLWHDTNRNFSMNAEMSRNVVQNFLVLLNLFIANAKILVEQTQNDDGRHEAITEVLSIIIFCSGTFYSEIEFNNSLVCHVIEFFVRELHALAPRVDLQTLPEGIKKRLAVFSRGQYHLDIFDGHVLFLKTAWQRAQVLAQRDPT